MREHGRRALRITASLAGVAVITYGGAANLNATTAGLGYLLFVLVVASGWGFVEAALASVAATLTLNYFFLPPVGTFTIADPENWVSLFSFLTSALIASRLSSVARQRTADAIERQQDLERLYSFSRSILLITGSGPDPFPAQLVRRLAEIFGFDAVALYDRRADQLYRAGPSEFDGLDEQLRSATLDGGQFRVGRRVIAAVRLGAEPIASLGIESSAALSDSVLQGIANLVAIGLERAQAQELAHQVEAARQTEQLRTALIDAMAHEFKTPLTSIRAATTALLSNPGATAEGRHELLKVADEEAVRLEELIDDALELAMVEEGRGQIRPEPTDLARLIGELVASLPASGDGRVTASGDPLTPIVSADRRLLRLAIKQVLDNALKYSLPGTPVEIRARPGLAESASAIIEITDHGNGIPPAEQSRIFERFYRGSGTQHRVPGRGLGLSIAQRVAEAHRGTLTVKSEPGCTIFRFTLPQELAA